jgi:hypothetical protein
VPGEAGSRKPFPVIGFLTAQDQPATVHTEVHDLSSTADPVAHHAERE